MSKIILKNLSKILNFKIWLITCQETTAQCKFRNAIKSVGPTGWNSMRRVDKGINKST